MISLIIKEIKKEPSWGDFTLASFLYNIGYYFMLLEIHVAYWA